jgi:phage terminase large subunit-like protein
VDYEPCSVDLYALDVWEGRIAACKWVRLACWRHLHDRTHGPDRGLRFDADTADRAIRFFSECLVFYEGEFDGKPFTLLPFEEFIVGSLFGWKTADEFRRFRTAYVEMAKGNGKSPLAAGIGLYGLIADKEPGAEIYSAATTRDQASILFRDAKAFVEGSEALLRRLIVDKGNIGYAAQNSFFRPVSSEHRGLDGKRPHIALIDEIHEHPSDIVVNKMRAGTKGRRQALIFEITNSGYDRHSVCYQHHEYTEKILEGVGVENGMANDSWFGYMTGLDVCENHANEGKSIPVDDCPDCDSWKDESKWLKANPGLDVIIPRKYLREQVAEASEMPSKENIVKRLNFCIWTESVTKWMSLDRWRVCDGIADPEELRGRSCYGGLDLSSVNDVTAWIKVFPPEEEGEKYKVLCRFFLPADNLRERVRRDKVPYDVWVRQGFITTTPGNIIDYAFILAAIEQDTKDFMIVELAFDRWGSQKITTDLQNLGFEVEGKKNLIQFGQGFASMAAPTKELEKMVLAGELAHGGNPVLAWMVSNTVVRTDPAGNIKPDKERSTERIDGVVGLVMGLSRAMLRVDDTDTVYSRRGVISG